MNKNIQAWAEKLLDTGNRNNLVNFKERKGTTVEFVAADPGEIFDSLVHGKEYDAFDTRDWFKKHSTENEVFPKSMGLDEYCKAYSPNLKKKEVLLYNPFDADSCRNVSKLYQKISSVIEETGVNIGYVFFGQIEWKNGNTLCKAPLLLLPITIEHESRNAPFSLAAADDEVSVNPTFNYKIKAEFGIELPKYDEEVGLSSYLASVENVVKKLGWSVASCCKIGLFSFQKINMYNDLMENESAILDNPNVQSILGLESGSLDHYEDLDEDFNELIDIHNVVDADSSQLEAIKLAKTGRSFVLQGPPGTGKSQTIANIIAECLYDGKKVLFVSEKQAALNVVFEKMKQVGLSDYCLELHSHKANKKAFVQELVRILNLPRVAVKSNEDSKKAVNQKQLDEYDRHLHEEKPVIQKSAFNVYSDFLKYKQAADVDYLIRDISKKGEAYRDKVSDAIGRYAEYSAKLGCDYKNSPWFGFVSQDTSIQGKAENKDDFEFLTKEMQQILPVISNLKDSFEIVISSIQEILPWREFLKTVPETKGLVPHIFEQNTLSGKQTFLVELQELCSNLEDLEDVIDSSFEKNFFKIDGNDLSKRLKLFDNALTRLFSKEYREIKKSLKMNAKVGVKISYENACFFARTLSAYQEKIKELESLDSKACLTFGRCYSGRKTDWDSLKNKLEQVSLCGVYPAGCEIVSGYSQEKFDQVCEEFGSIVDELDQFLLRTKDCIARIDGKFDPDVFNCESTSFETVISKLTGCLEDIDNIETWKFMNLVLRELEELDSLDYLDYCSLNNIPLEGMKDAYNKRFYALWIDYLRSTDEVLGYFDRVTHDSVMEQFSESDRNDLIENRKRIAEHLQAERPFSSCGIVGSGVWLINREADKKKKIKPIRRLIDEAGETIQAIKPCFLMSPLSVGTFIPSNSITFDTVIFDEASQVFPQDAIGAIYRGAQIIVVGDSKQMPPTNFFNADLDVGEEDDYDDLTDYESILDLCSSSFKQLSLLWHYRSRFEQLIAFSNHNFYEGKLISFPSATIDRKGIGVDYYHVDGVFEHKSRYNIKEAERVVDLILEHVRNYPNRSLGVVAFNVAQQELIGNLLDKRVGFDSQYDILYDRNLLEPFFIKNLESVQGDERDTIIFSTAYGKDASGKLMHNFGPLNRQGGERRLNVAVSRARINVQVVSSMHGTDIDLTRTSARGAQLLKSYLDFAEKGSVALFGNITVNPEDHFDSLFEVEVCEFLRANGYTVDTQIGCSGFRIDLGVRKPDSSEYFLVVECDGASYHSCKNARDRDRLRQEILERMGWNFYRVWSTDWFRHGSDEKERLLNAVKTAEELGVKPFAESQKQIALPNENEVVEEIQKAELKFPEFHYNNEVVFGARYTKDFADNVKKVLMVELAISKKSLLNRIVEAQYNKQRVSKNIEKEFNGDISACLYYGIEERNGFLYLKGSADIPFRVPGDKRLVEDISLEELSNGMLALIKQGFSIEKSALFKSLNSLLGFERLGPNIQERFEMALERLSDSVEFNGSRVSLK